MAEILGIVAGAIACLQATDLLVEYTPKLYRVGRKMKVAKKEIKAFASNVDDFIITVRSACIAIKVHTPSKVEDYQPVLQYLAGKKMIQRALKQYYLVEETLLREIPDIRDLKYKSELRVRLNWVRHSRRVKEATTAMESVKVTFLLLTQSIVLEGLRRLERTPAVHEQM
jgi:hypothetical protein